MKAVRTNGGRSDFSKLEGSTLEYLSTMITILQRSSKNCLWLGMAFEKFGEFNIAMRKSKVSCGVQNMLSVHFKAYEISEKLVQGKRYDN